MLAVLDQREMPAKLNHGGQFAALLIGAADGFGSGGFDGEHG